ncbi:galactose-3-O-sulfotransferase 1 [Mactra antiquata]
MLACSSRFVTMSRQKRVFGVIVMVIIVLCIAVTRYETTVTYYIPARLRLRPNGLDFFNNSIKDSSEERKVAMTTHIAFLKVHKAGSTTMQNMFFRFGLKYNLTFVLPGKGNYFLRTSQALPVRDGNHFDILACHSVYDRGLYRSVLPNDTVNVAIIRDPLERMVSAAYYYRDMWHSPPLVKVPKINFIHNIILRPDLYEKSTYSKTKNAMGKDFGFLDSVTKNDTEKIKTHLLMLDNDFKLVMVMERFDESLVLMKRYLNWRMEDIIYLLSNSHDHQPVVLNKTEKALFKSTCFLDYAIYDFFTKIFEERVRKEGTSLKIEVAYFKKILENVKNFCTSNKLSYVSLNIEQSQWNNPFRITYEDCTYMKLRELKFIYLLRTRHLSKNNVSDSII